jgi:hypothetical protein
MRSGPVRHVVPRLQGHDCIVCGPRWFVAGVDEKTLLHAFKIDH